MGPLTLAFQRPWRSHHRADRVFLWSPQGFSRNSPRLFKALKGAVDGKPFSWDKLERTAAVSTVRAESRT